MHKPEHTTPQFCDISTRVRVFLHAPVLSFHLCASILANGTGLAGQGTNNLYKEFTWCRWETVNICKGGYMARNTHVCFLYIYIYISIDSSYICIWRAHNYRINHSRQSFFRSTDEYLNYFRVHLCVLMRNMVRKYKKFTNRKKHLRGHLPRHPLYDNTREKSQTNYKSTQNKSNKTKKIIADE